MLRLGTYTEIEYNFDRRDFTSGPHIMPTEEGSRKKNVFKRDVRKNDDFDGEKNEEAEQDDIEIDIASHGERPSVRAKLSLAAKAGISNRPRIPNDPSCLYRVYLATSQRVPLQLSQLNSAAAYLLICDADNRVMIWLGSNCPDTDIIFAKEMGLEIFRRDMRNYDATEIEDIIWEGREAERPALLKILLAECGTDEGTYRGKRTIAERKNEIENQPLCMSIMEKMPLGTFELLEIGYATPNEAGSIRRIPFSPIELDTIILTSVDNQWDIWIARGNSPEDEEAAMKYVINCAVSRAGCTEAVARNSIRVMRQGYERVTYRRYFKVLTDFEPPGRTVPWTTTVVKKKSEKAHQRPAVSKRFALGNEKEEDYGQPMDTGYDFISGIFGSIETYRPAISLELPNKGPSTNSFIVKNNEEGSHEEKNNNTQPVEIKMFDEEDEEGAEEASDKYESEDSIKYVGGKDVYKVEADDAVVETMPEKNAVITKLTEGRGCLTKEMLVFLERQQVAPQERLELLTSAATNPQLLVGWQVPHTYHTTSHDIIIFCDYFSQAIEYLNID